MLELAHITKTFPPITTVLHDVSLQVARGEIVCLLGPSGCGKTTLLRIVAGLEQPDAGDQRSAVLLDGQDLRPIPVHKRNFGLMFQEFALFPHKSVADNVAYGLRMANYPASRIAERVAEMLALVSLRGYDQRTIFELSGGERQRVALARSLAPAPRLLMLDEPLGNLDRTLREQLMTELRTILKRLGLTALYVTHDQQEALAVADRVVIMQQGKIAQIGTPKQIYWQPANAFVARFLGFANLLPATVASDDPQVAQTQLGRVSLAQPAAPGAGTLLIRPQALLVGSDAEVSRFRANVEDASFRGTHLQVSLRVDTATDPIRLVVDEPADSDLRRGEEISFGIRPEACMLLPAS